MAAGRSKKEDGTEGTATCKLTHETTTGVERKVLEKELKGCFVCNDENLKHFISNSIKKADDRNIFATSTFYFYTPYLELGNPEQYKAEIQFHQYSHPNKRKPIELGGLHSVPVDKSHLFFVCQSEELEKCEFVKRYSKKIRVDQSLSTDIFGLGRDKLAFIPLKIKRNDHESNSNKYDVQNSEDFEKLADAGPILLEDKKTVVGCFRKDTVNQSILTSIFGREEKTKDPEEVSDTEVFKKNQANDELQVLKEGERADPENEEKVDVHQPPAMEEPPSQTVEVDVHQRPAMEKPPSQTVEVDVHQRPAMEKPPLQRVEGVRKNQRKREKDGLEDDLHPGILKGKRLRKASKKQ